MVQNIRTVTAGKSQKTDSVRIAWHSTNNRRRR